MHRIIRAVRNEGKWPEDWTQSTFVPLFKKGDPAVCANYRTISLISHASKVLLKVILGRIKDRPRLKWRKNKLDSDHREVHMHTSMQPQNLHRKSQSPPTADVHVLCGFRESL